ncbi:MAG: hypothetical protein IKJ13_07800 [Clostridia bacterium]|nr:hypothetical protein [Clostridia bacterium]
MKYKVIEIESTCTDDAAVEMRYAIASARAGGAELIRFDIPVTDDEKEYKKLFNSLVRLLKGMKEERLIQFYATEKSFSDKATESAFLLNKYPSIFICGLTDNQRAGFIYVKI